MASVRFWSRNRWQRTWRRARDAAFICGEVDLVELQRGLGSEKVEEVRQEAKRRGQDLEVVVFKDLGLQLHNLHHLATCNTYT